MTDTPARTRFAPSPTGRLHLGNARTALFNWLFARHAGGRFILRVEDTDTERSTAEHLDSMLGDMRWLGLDWDEGPDRGGRYAPYVQSRRGETYETYFARLEKAGRLYPCFCSRRELELARKAQLAAGKAPRYPGTCARLNEDEARERIGRGEAHSWRFRVPEGERVEFRDLVHGHQCFGSDDIGDFVVRRSDGTAAFFFSNAVDDALMGITHVFRGDDHLTNTPRQLMILEALDLPAPEYGHIALVHAEDGGPLSKRSGSRSVADFRSDGILPLALANYLARLGHRYEDGGFRDERQLAADFDVARFGRAPARFDPDQLAHWQREAVIALSGADAWSWIADAVDEWVPPGRRDLFVEAVQPNILSPAEAREWAMRLFDGIPEPVGDAYRVISEAGRGFFEAAVDALDEAGADYQALTERLKRDTGARGRSLFRPLRAALTGRLDGPKLGILFELVGTPEVRRRFWRCAEIA